MDYYLYYNERIIMAGELISLLPFRKINPRKMGSNMDKKTILNVRSSAAEFLIFSLQEEADTIEVLYQDESLWFTQKMMGQLFDVETNTITYHLKEIFNSGELEREATTRKF